MRWLFFSLTVAGIGLRLWQYAGGASLWIDELALARNIVDRPLGRLLFEPLDYDQIAPRGFLLVEKLAVSALGANEYALRLFPLLCGIAAVPLFRQVAERVLSRGAAALALALFAVGIPLVWYSAQVKQYSSDTAIALLLFLLVLRLRDADGAPYSWIVGAIGAGLLFFSHAAVFVLTGLGAALIAAALMDRDRRRLFNLIPVILLWIAGGVGVMVDGFLAVSPETRRYFEQYWGANFMPVPPHSVADVLWVGRQLNRTFAEHSVSYPWPMAYTALMAAGVAGMWRRQSAVALLLFLPAAVTVTASALRLYPFGGRVIIFLVPCFLVAVAEGVDQIRRLFARWPYAGIALLAAAAVPSAYRIIARPPVYRLDETRPVFAYLRTHRRPDDAVYVYYGAWQAARFYGPAYGLAPHQYFVGGCHRGATRRYLEEIDRFRGRPRVWVLFSPTLSRPREREDIIKYLDAIGTRADSFTGFLPWPPRITSPGYLYLYDLSDPERLGSAAADAFPVEDALARDIGTGCLRGPHVPTPGS